MDSYRAIRGLRTRALLTCVVVTLHAGMASAQWIQTNGPRGGGIRSFATVPDGAGGTHLFAGQLDVWRTSDRGASWARSGNGLVDPNGFALLAIPSGSGGHDLLVGTNAGIFRSSDLGATWSPINNGITNPSVYALASGPSGSGGTNLYAGTYMGSAFRSSDNGASWTAINSGLPVGQANVNALTTGATGTILAGTTAGIYRSTNFGGSWTRVFTHFAFAFARHGSTHYVGTSSGVFRSSDDGATWIAINNGMVFNWTYAVAAIPDGSGGATLFAGTGIVHRSTNNGATWTPVTNGLTSLGIRVFATVPNAAGGTDLYAGTDDGIFRTSDNGNTWTNVSFIYSQVQAIDVTPVGTILAGSENDLYRSTNGGATWTDTQSSTTALDFAVNPHGSSGVSILAGGSPSGIYKSTNDGASWTYASNGLDDFDVNSMGVIPNGSGGSNLLAGTYSELFISRNDGGSWQQTGLRTLTLDYAVTANGAGGHNVYAAGFGGVWRSTDYGSSWTPVSAGLQDKAVQAIAATAGGANLFAGGGPFGVFRSTDNGATWVPVNNGLTNLHIFALLSPDGVHLFAGGGGGVFLSEDHGNTWTSVNTGLTTGVYNMALSADGSTLLVGSTGLGVWKRPLAEMIDGVPPPPPPPAPPSIASFTPASGPAGTDVTITGSNFAGTSAVTFNLTPASSFAVLSATQIRATVPSGASTGRIRVTTPAGTATSGSDFIVPLPPAPTTLTFTPSHDAWVRSSSPSSNFGSTGELRVRATSQTIRSYLKFDVSGVSGAVQSATLRLRVTDGGPNGGSLFAASNTFAGTSTPWTESQLTWNNAPGVTGSALAMPGPVSSNTWVELDVTAAVTGNGARSFAILGNSRDLVDYSSSEGANPPELVLVVAGSGTTAQETAPVLSEVSLPEQLSLRGNHPNPFDVGTTIAYSLPRAMAARLVIYDVTGRAVRTLVDGTQEAGTLQVTWDGRDDRGSRVSPGMYVYRLEADGISLSRKMSLVR